MDEPKCFGALLCYFAVVQCLVVGCFVVERLVVECFAVVVQAGAPVAAMQHWLVVGPAVQSWPLVGGWQTVVVSATGEMMAEIWLSKGVR